MMVDPPPNDSRETDHSAARHVKQEQLEMPMPGPNNTSFDTNLFSPWANFYQPGFPSPSGFPSMNGGSGGNWGGEWAAQFGGGGFGGGGVTTPGTGTGTGFMPYYAGAPNFAAPYNQAGYSFDQPPQGGQIYHQPNTSLLGLGTDNTPSSSAGPSSISRGTQGHQSFPPDYNPGPPAGERERESNHSQTPLENHNSYFPQMMANNHNPNSSAMALSLPRHALEHAFAKRLSTNLDEISVVSSPESIAPAQLHHLDAPKSPSHLHIQPHHQTSHPSSHPASPHQRSRAPSRKVSRTDSVSTHPSSGAPSRRNSGTPPSPLNSLHHLEVHTSHDELELEDYAGEDSEHEGEGVERNGMIWGMNAVEYKALSARERKRIRNRISARTFRARRKEHLSSLETTLSDKDQLIKRLQEENIDLKKRLGHYEKPYDRVPTNGSKRGSH